MKTFIQYVTESEVPASDTPVAEQAPVPTGIKPSGAVMKLGGPWYPPFQRDAIQSKADSRDHD
jgi:hypothetical protein